MIEAKTNAELEEIKRKIERARKWARKHFNATSCNDKRLFDENLQLLPPSAFVDFPGPDRMNVTLSRMGMRSVIVFEYRLHFAKDGTLFWQTNHPIYGTPFPPWVVSE